VDCGYGCTCMWGSKAQQLEHQPGNQKRFKFIFQSECLLLMVPGVYWRGKCPTSLVFLSSVGVIVKLLVPGPLLFPYRRDGGHYSL